MRFRLISCDTLPIKVFNYSHCLTVLFFLGCIIGIIQFIFLYGTDCLSPLNTRWMINADSDAYVHYIGWECFNSESWSFPLGRINNILVPLGSSVVLTDSIPWLAIPCKIFSHLFYADKHFQYFGIYGMFSFALQGGLSAIILKKWIRQGWLCLVCIPVFVYSDPMLCRMFGHTALAGQFFILGGIATYIYSEKLSFKLKMILWSLLCGISMCNHPYIGFMLCIMFTFTCINYAVILKQDLWQCVVLFCVVALISSMMFYLAGGFIAKPADDFHLLGQGALNLNSLFDSHGSSRLFPSLAKSPTIFHGEGYQFLGIGIIFLLPLAISGIIMLWKRYGFQKVFQYSPVILFSVFMFILALSPTIYFGNRILVQYEISEMVSKMWEIFRSTGRLFWSVFYILTIGIIVCSYHALKKGMVACILISLAVAVQMYDFIPYLSNIHSRFEQRFSENNTSLPTGEWESILADIVEIDLVEPFSVANDNIRFMELSANLHLRTNTIYGSHFEADQAFKYAHDLVEYTEKYGKLPNNHLLVFTNKYYLYHIIKSIDLKKCKLFVKNGYLCAINNDNFNTNSKIDKIQDIYKMPFLKYITTLNNKNEHKIHIFSARLDGISKLTTLEKEGLKDIGLLNKCSNIQNESYIAVFKNGFNLMAEKWSDNLLTYNLENYSLKSNLVLQTRGNKIPWGGNWFDAVLLKNGKIVSPQANGLTIFIYDTEADIFDEIAFFEGGDEGVVIPGKYFDMMLP